jgi:hypothetical protein
VPARITSNLSEKVLRHFTPDTGLEVEFVMEQSIMDCSGFIVKALEFFKIDTSIQSQAQVDNTVSLVYETPEITVEP